MNPFDSPSQIWLMSNTLLFTFKGRKSKLKLKILSMDFWFEFLDIYMNEKVITCHDFHGFTWKNINIYLILTIFLCGPMPFLVHWIMIAHVSIWIKLRIVCSLVEFQTYVAHNRNYFFTKSTTMSRQNIQTKRKPNLLNPWCTLYHIVNDFLVFTNLSQTTY
jgi:hypothetical protein